MASTAVTEVIFFIAAALTAGALVGVFGGVSNNLKGGIEVGANGIANQLRTSIAIINDPLSMESTTLTLYVKNVGSSTLRTNGTDVLLDGVPYTNATYDVLSSTDDTKWRVGEVVQITVGGVVTAGDHRAKVVSENGISDEIEFHRS